MPLDGTVRPEPPGRQFNCDEQSTLKPKQTYVEGCPVLPKLQCHEVQMGQYARLLWTFKNPQGEPINLRDCLNACSEQSVSSQSEAFDVVGDRVGCVTLRMRELSGMDPYNDPIFTIAAEIVDDVGGVVRSDPLPEALVRAAGIYTEEWGFFASESRMLFSNQCCTFVRRGLFGIQGPEANWNAGPPTIEEIRLSMRDNSGEDNFLLNEVEFDAAEIAQAVLRPVMYWNETPPPLRPMLTTKTFPFREMWLLGTQAYLLETAAHHYRRNQLAYNAGGVAVDDKNKERQYLESSNRLLMQFREMLRAKKIEMNIAMFNGAIGSPYSGLFYN